MMTQDQNFSRGEELNKIRCQIPHMLALYVVGGDIQWVGALNVIMNCRTMNHAAIDSSTHAHC